MPTRFLNTQFISLRQAAAKTGYHPDYLAFLCRTGRLAGTKIGRKWATTSVAIDELLVGKIGKGQNAQEGSEVKRTLEPNCRP